MNRKFCWAALLGAAVSLGCTDSPATVRLEVYSWWQTPSEDEAFQRVRQIHERNHPNVEIVTLGDPESDETIARMASRMLAKDPPATFQANVGADLLGWAVFDTQPLGESVAGWQSARWIEPLTALYERIGLRHNLRPGLWEHLVAGTEPYGVPINIHRLNVIYYNRSEFDAFQRRRPGKSLDDLSTLCPADPEYDPWDPELDLGIDIAIGTNKDKFAIVLLAIENVLPAIVRRNRDSAEEARDFYDALFRGEMPGPRENGVSVHVREAFRCVQFLARWFRRVGDDEYGWARAVDSVRVALEAPRPAAFTVMGDWANGAMAAELRDDIVIRRPFPGTDEVFVYTSDTFPLPIGTRHRGEVEALLETIASRNAQLAFSAAKGSIPARDDVETDSLETWQRETAAAYDGGQTVHILANSAYFPLYYPEEELQDALIAMTVARLVNEPADEDQRPFILAERERMLDAALRVFTDAEPILAHWQSRLAGGASDPIEP